MKILKKNKKKNKQIFFKSILGDLSFFLIDNKIKIPLNIEINSINNTLNFKSILGPDNLNLKKNKFINYFLYKKYLYIFFNNINKKNKKNILNLYISLINLKIKGILQEFKLTLLLNGLGFKALIKNNNLILKIGYSHLIEIKIPNQIKIVNQTNKLILSSIDLIKLTQYIHLIKSYKKPEPYKGKGILLKNEYILRKEGKKSKK